ncbi:ATP-binding cassette domain-containing protein [Calothrix sp. 336/3]|uniref:ATP-binding cassette domain-containing protein n=1 Tax=Calothrix sp. 336/3 TaxID=1337936 RepID=UPI0004E453DD|nr:ATP-binding cassette domain-containing protein [Calothrix sp. 336/3]AKG21453.1 aliphatic sulfonates transport ATP-binding subunit [Calothrix sp. 336/3]
MSQKAQGTELKVWDLTKTFGGNTVLHSLNLEAKSGEFIAIVGRSGCGKSTLLRLIAGLETPTDGGILLDDKPQHQLKDSVRVMFQDSRLLEWKYVLNNVGLGLKGDNWREKAFWALSEVGLKGRENDWPSVLSGGQRQRVALARALVSEPRLLLLDEPLGALDALTRIEMHNLIETLWQEQTFTALLVTHDVEEAVVLGDRVVLIESGRIVLDEKVDLPRPRDRGNPKFVEIRERVLERVLRREDVFYEKQFQYMKP